MRTRGQSRRGAVRCAGLAGPAAAARTRGCGRRRAAPRPQGRPPAPPGPPPSPAAAHALTPMPGMMAKGTLAMAPIRNEAIAAVAAVAVTSE